MSAESAKASSVNVDKKSAATPLKSTTITKATKASKANKHEKSQKITNNINEPNTAKKATLVSEHDSTSSNLAHNYCNNLYEIDANQSRVSCGSLSRHKQAQQQLAQQQLQQRQQFQTTNRSTGANQSQLRNPSSVSFSGVSTNGSSSDQNCYNSNPTTSLINNSSSNILTKSSLKSARTTLSAANLAKIETQKQIAAVDQLTKSASGMIKPITEVYDQLREVEQQVYFRKKLDGRGSQQHLVLQHPSQIAMASNANRHFQIKDKYDLANFARNLKPGFTSDNNFTFQVQIRLHHLFPLRPCSHASLEHLSHSHRRKILVTSARQIRRLVAAIYVLFSSLSIISSTRRSVRTLITKRTFSSS